MVRVYGKKVIYLTTGDLTGIWKRSKKYVRKRFTVRSQQIHSIRCKAKKDETMV